MTNEEKKVLDAWNKYVILKKKLECLQTRHKLAKRIQYDPEHNIDIDVFLLPDFDLQFVIGNSTDQDGYS